MSGPICLSCGGPLPHAPSHCLACGNALAENERDLCDPCKVTIAADLAQHDKPFDYPGSRCTSTCGYCGRCGGA